MTPDEWKEVAVRGEIYKAISDMLDNPGECKIYPTTKCYDRLEKFFKQALAEAYRKGRKDMITELCECAERESIRKLGAK